MAREQNRNARLKALRDGTFEEVNMDDDTIVEALVEALVAGPSPAGTIEPVAGEAGEPLWISDAVCEKPYVDAAIVISDDEDDEDDEESEVAKAEVAEVAKAEVGQAPRLPFSCPFMVLPTHDSDPDPDHDLTCPESPVSPASPASPAAPEGVEDYYIDTVARRRAANDALRAGFAKAFAAIAAIEKEEDQRATPAPIAAEVLALVSAPHARQPPGTQVTAADTEMVEMAAEEGTCSMTPGLAGTLVRAYLTNDGDAYDNAVKLYHELNGGVLYGRIKIVKLPKDKDVCDLKGDIKEYYIDLMR